MRESLGREEVQRVIRAQYETKMREKGAAEKSASFEKIIVNYLRIHIIFAVACPR